MPTFTHGISAVIKIDNDAGSLTNYTTYIKSFSFPRQVGSAETSTLGDTFQQFVSGLKGGTFTISGPFDVTFFTILNTSFTNGSGTTKTIEVNPQGTTSTYLKYTFEAFVTSLDVNADIGAAGEYSATFQITGTITQAAN
jgi:hypothetical protein